MSRFDDEDLPIELDRCYFVMLGYFGEGDIATMATHDSAKVESWIDQTLRRNECRIPRLIVGLDIEWSPDFIKDCDHSVAILQLCVGASCLVYQILHAKGIPKKLREFLEDPGFTFVGVGIKNNVQRLWKDHRLRVVNTRDLSSWAAEELGKKELKGAGLKVLGKEVLGQEMDNLKCDTSCRWDNRELSRKQVTYASLDGYFSFEIGRRLSAWY